MTAPPTSFQAYFEGLTQIVSGEVYRRGDDQFQEYTRIFINNESVLKTVNAVVLPLDTQDVSEYAAHGLSLSVTTCEYGTDGWAIDGDVVIDLSKIQDIDIEPPQRGGGYTSLSDTALSTNKGKARVGEPVLELSDRSVAKQFSSPPSDLPTAWFCSGASTTSHSDNSHFGPITGSGCSIETSVQSSVPLRQPGASRELYANVLLIAGPANEYSLVVIHMCYAGPKNRVLSTPGVQLVGRVTQLLRGKQWFIHSALISSLPDEVIYKTVIEFAESPVGCEYRAKSESHFSAQREAAFTIAALHQWGMGDDDQRRLSSAENVRSSPPLWFLRITRSFPPPTKQWLREMIKSEACGRAFPSWCNAQFLGWHEIPTRVSASFDENSERLVALKKKYDPIGLFRGHILAIDEDVREMDPTSDR
ncbi:hypothetical protein BJV77DRAFT_1072053 [Russula vinacea]|nr:hypothetical protein BJV77DRAFT_1072053 [Russula vinacea]